MNDRYSFRILAPAGRVNGRPDHSELTPSLVIGEYPTPEDAAWLRSDLRVTAVVNLQDDSDLAGKALRLADLRAAYDVHDIDFHHVPIPDGDGQALAATLGHVVGLLGQLVANGRRVYVHCNAGMNRAPTVAIAYLHVHEDMTLGDARDFVKERRVCLPYMTVLDAVYGTKRIP